MTEEEKVSEKEEEEELDENRVKLEKGSIIGIAITSLSLGVQMISQGRITEGLILVAVGFGLLFLREHLKFHRWHSVNNWRGVEYGKTESSTSN